MLSAASRGVMQHKADLSLCFDGDGDRRSHLVAYPEVGELQRVLEP